MLQRTHAGIHRDDIDIRLTNQPFKNIASQGQRKSLLFAMKLAEYELLKKTKGFAPIILLDDVFEKLDAHRECISFLKGFALRVMASYLLQIPMKTGCVNILKNYRQIMH